MRFGVLTMAAGRGLVSSPAWIRFGILIRALSWVKFGVLTMSSPWQLDKDWCPHHGSWVRFGALTMALSWRRFGIITTALSWVQLPLLCSFSHKISASNAYKAVASSLLQQQSSASAALLRLSQVFVNTSVLQSLFPINTLFFFFLCPL